MNPEGGGCGEPRSFHCTPVWVTTAKLHLKKKKKEKENGVIIIIPDKVEFRPKSIKIDKEAIVSNIYYYSSLTGRETLKRNFLLYANLKTLYLSYIWKYKNYCIPDSKSRVVMENYLNSFRKRKAYWIVYKA